MAKYIKLTPSQKDEIRRLTQLANRRIRNAEKAYRKEGKTILPREIAGEYQLKEKWNTKNSPISRSVKFESEREYRRQLNFLRSFEVTRPGIREYTQVQREKTRQAVESTLGVDAPDNISEKLERMSAPQLADFWNRFSNKASKLGVRYSSTQAMQMTMNEMFPDDMQQIERTV